MNRQPTLLGELVEVRPLRDDDFDKPQSPLKKTLYLTDIDGWARRFYVKNSAREKERLLFCAPPEGALTGWAGASRYRTTLFRQRPTPGSDDARAEVRVGAVEPCSRSTESQCLRFLVC